MYSRNPVIKFILITSMALIVGCSQADDPVTPNPEDTQLSAAGEVQAQSNPHTTWGLWQIGIEASTGEAEVIPLRSAMWHLNPLIFLEKNGHSTIVLNNVVVNGALVDVNVGLTHPFPGQYQWSGFDVRGVFIADGSYDEFASSGDLRVADPDEPRLWNADGWTRWWNPHEFPMRGSILGYTDGVFGISDQQINYRATLNPYKYFTDGLGQNSDFPDDLDFDRRGFFLASSNVNWRHYTINFGGSANWYIFNYAVDACHQFGPGQDGSFVPGLSQVPDPYFPIEANMPEAFAIVPRTDANTLYYAGPTQFGGDLILFIDVYDWQGIRGEDGIPAEIEDIYVESPKLLGSEIVPAMPAGDEEYFSTYVAALVNCHPDGLQNQDILITVVSTDGDYETGYDGYPTGFIGTADVAAYHIYTPAVSPEIPAQIEIIQVTVPNGGEVWVSGDTETITWVASSSIDFVRIEYSDNGGSSWYPIDGGSGIVSNTGSYVWTIPSDLASPQMLVSVSDASDGDPTDQSDALFAIENLSLTFPNASGDDFQVGVSSQYIQWEIGSSTTQVIANLYIEFSKNGGADFEYLNNALPVPAGPLQWEWNPGIDDVTTEGRIRITADGYPGLTDTSDEDFEVYEMHVLELSEYLSWFTGGSKTFRGRYNSSLGALQDIYYDGTVTSWDFTSPPLSTYIGSSNFTVQFSSNVPRVAGAPTWGSNNWGMRTSINGPANRRAWWVMRFDTTNERLYNRGTTYYQDATFDDITLPGWCLDYIPCNMTEQFGASTTNDIQFPIDEDTTPVTIGGSGTMYWVNYDLYCSGFNDEWSVSYQTGSVFEVLAFGDVTVPHGGGTTYPHCLLVKMKTNIGPQTQIVHTGQLLYQWIDCDNGLVVAFIWTHNEGSATAGIPYTTGYSGDHCNLGIIAAYN